MQHSSLEPNCQEGQRQDDAEEGRQQELPTPDLLDEIEADEGAHEVDAGNAGRHPEVANTINVFCCNCNLGTYDTRFTIAKLP